MGLRLTCPKCETALREGTRRCPMCAAPLTDDLFRPRERTEGDPITDPLLELFERDEPVRHCPECLNEFLGHVKRCAGCRRDLSVLARSRYEAVLLARPVADRGAAVLAAPRKRTAGMRRVAVLEDAERASAMIAEFRALGVQAWPGDDASEPAADDPQVALYVREPDLSTADYLLGGRPPPSTASRPGEDARSRDLRAARLYHRFGRFRRALALASRHAGDAEADALAYDALADGGAMREAERRAAAASDAAAPGAERAARLFSAGVFAALGNDGAPFGPGANVDVALARLKAAAVEAPRRLDVGKAIVEVHAARRKDADTLDECRRLARLNPNLFARDGWFSTLFDGLRLKSA
ncbi:MAG TPA: hypothetical protein VEI02_02475 [Planctomycetota bacterium]|nr:hypothetical protein [Planctomycetota bacterium]